MRFAYAYAEDSDESEQSSQSIHCLLTPISDLRYNLDSVCSSAFSSAGLANGG